MLFPIGDDDRNLSGPAWVTWALLLANLFVFFYLQGAGANEAFTYGYSVVPQEITTGTDITEAQAITVDGERVEIPQAPGPTPIYLTFTPIPNSHRKWGSASPNSLARLI